MDKRAAQRRLNVLWAEYQAYLEQDSQLEAILRLAQLYDGIEQLPGPFRRDWQARLASVKMDDKNLAAVQKWVDNTIDTLNRVCSSGNLIGEEVILVQTMHQELGWMALFLRERGRTDIIDYSRIDAEALKYVGLRRSASPEP